jgi:hypothetical protein
MASTDVTLVYQLAAAKWRPGIENRGPEKRSEDPKLATSGPGDRQPPIGRWAFSTDIGVS